MIKNPYNHPGIPTKEKKENKEGINRIKWALKPGEIIMDEKICMGLGMSKYL